MIKTGKLRKAGNETPNTFKTSTQTNHNVVNKRNSDLAFWIFRVWDLFGCGLFRISYFGFRLAGR
jgi:hypothetical protein